MARGHIRACFECQTPHDKVQECNCSLCLPHAYTLAGMIICCSMLHSYTIWPRPADNIAALPDLTGTEAELAYHGVQTPLQSGSLIQACFEIPTASGILT